MLIASFVVAFLEDAVLEKESSLRQRREEVDGKDVSTLPESSSLLE